MTRNHPHFHLRLCATLLITGLFGLPGGVLAAGPPRVAVFSQTGFPFYGPPDLTSPKAIARDLTSAGLQADVLDAAALADPAKFNSQTYDAVVLPYGNTYPQEAVADLRAFHQGGGSLILSGIPFTHAVMRVPGADGRETWADVGGEIDGFGPDGIGAGRYGDNTAKPVQTLRGNPFRLTRRDWPGRAQVLDIGSLPKTDTVTPVLVSSGQVVAALITHKGDGFDGAVDAWTNYPHPTDPLLDASLSQDMLERGTVAALAAKGRLSPRQARQAMTAINSAPRPPVYANVTLPSPPRPYPTLQPKSPPLARHLYVADARKLTPNERRLLVSLQGLVNRKQPRIWFIFNDEDQFWRDTLQKQGYTDDPIAVADPFSLLTTFRADYHGAVVPDPNIYVSPDVAVDFAGADDLVIATPELAARYGLPVQVDLRGKFKDDVDAMRYVRLKLLPRLNPYFGAVLSPQILGHEIDQIIAAKGVCFWATGPMEQDEPGTDRLAEAVELEALLAQMPLGALIRGYPWAGDGSGLGEHPGVTLFSRFGKMLTASDWVTNWSVLSGVQLTSLKQKPQPPAPKLDPSKVYLAITLSDGDNLGIWRGAYHDSLVDPLHGTFPIAYGMGPTLIDAAPPLAQWAYEHMAPTDEFVCDVSGAGYIYPPDFGAVLKDRKGALKRFFTDWTQSYMRRLDMKGLRVMGLDPPSIAEVGADTPQVPYLIPDYGYAGEKSYGELTYTLPTGQPVFRAISYGPNSEDLVREIRSRVGSTRPAFINAFVFFWGFNMSKLKQALDALGPEYVPVTPSQLNALYRQAQTGKAR